MQWEEVEGGVILSLPPSSLPSPIKRMIMTRSGADIWFDAEDIKGIRLSSSGESIVITLDNITIFLTLAAARSITGVIDKIAVSIEKE